MQHGMPSLRDKSGWRHCNRKWVWRGKWNIKQRWYRIGYLFLRPHPCRTVALDIQMERIRKSQDTGLAGITLCLGPLPLHPFPFPSEHAGVAHPHSLCTRFPSTWKRPDSRIRDSLIMGFSAPRA